jgi:hypothetical protein
LLDPPLLVLVELKKPASPNAPFPEPPVAHAKASPPSERKTIPRAANRPRTCILSVYLSVLPLQGVPGPLRSQRRPRDSASVPHRYGDGGGPP